MNRIQIKIPNCLECGVCCTHKDDSKWIQVSKDDTHNINREYLNDGDIELFAMKMVDFRCICLEGLVLKDCKCIIYDNRPTICREVKPGDDVCIESLVGLFQGLVN